MTSAHGERELELDLECRECETVQTVTFLASYDWDEIWGTWKCPKCGTGNEWCDDAEKYFDESPYDTISEREGR